MALKCEFPEGCKLDLWAKVIKAKFIEKQAKILETVFCVPDEQVCGKISCIDDIKVRLIGEPYEEIQCFNKVRICFTYEVILFVIVQGEYQIVTLTDTYERFIELDEFDPPFTPEELKAEVDQSEIILKNWSFDYDIKGDCENACNPCNLTTPINGTGIGLRVYVDIIDKLGKMHDVIVYGEFDPEVDY